MSLIFNNIKFSDDNSVIIATIKNSNKLYISYDTCLSWFEYKTPNIIKNVYCSSNGNIILIDTFTELYISSNKITWKKIFEYNTNLNIITSEYIYPIYLLFDDKIDIIDYDEFNNIHRFNNNIIKNYNPTISIDRSIILINYFLDNLFNFHIIYDNGNISKEIKFYRNNNELIIKKIISINNKIIIIIFNFTIYYSYDEGITWNTIYKLYNEKDSLKYVEWIDCVYSKDLKHIYLIGYATFCHTGLYYIDFYNDLINNREIDIKLKLNSRITNIGCSNDGKIVCITLNDVNENTPKSYISYNRGEDWTEFSDNIKDQKIKKIIEAFN